MVGAIHTKSTNDAARAMAETEATFVTLVAPGTSATGTTPAMDETDPTLETTQGGTTSGTNGTDVAFGLIRTDATSGMTETHARIVTTTAVSACETTAIRGKNAVGGANVIGGALALNGTIRVTYGMIAATLLAVPMMLVLDRTTGANLLLKGKNLRYVYSSH